MINIEKAQKSYEARMKLRSRLSKNVGEFHIKYNNKLRGTSTIPLDSLKTPLKGTKSLKGYVDMGERNLHTKRNYF